MITELYLQIKEKGNDPVKGIDDMKEKGSNQLLQINDI